MIPISKSSPRGGAPVRLIVIHTAEGARTTGDLAAYFSGPVEASSHVGIDDRAIEQYLPYERSAWTMLSANAISDQAELCGFAVWTRDQWLRDHAGMIRLAAQWIRERCAARRIPIRKLTPWEVAAGEGGVCGHWDWTVGMHEGTHTDPGSGFPWDVVITTAAQGGGVTPSPLQEDDVSWSDQLPDLYPGALGPDGRPTRSIDAGTQLAFASARTAQTLDGLSALRNDVGALSARVGALAQAGGPAGPPPAIDYGELAKALLAEMANRA